MLNSYCQRIRGKRDKRRCLGERFIGAAPRRKTITSTAHPKRARLLPRLSHERRQRKLAGRLRDTRTTNYQHRGERGDALGYQCAAETYSNWKHRIPDRHPYERIQRKKSRSRIGRQHGRLFSANTRAWRAIIVLGLSSEGTLPVGRIIGTGKHVGRSLS
jgi:hypothetical protein